MFLQSMALACSGVQSNRIIWRSVVALDLLSVPAAAASLPISFLLSLLTLGSGLGVTVSRNSALLAVSKKDSTLKRFCINLRPLNKQCKKLSVFQGSIDTNLDRLHRSVLYGAFDMSSGFMAVPLEDSSKQCFATSPRPTKAHMHSWFFRSAGLTHQRSMLDL